MSKQILFDEDSDEEPVSLKIENEYAKKYDNWREKEELHKLEQKYGNKSLNSDASSDSEDESDEPLEVSEEMEQQFLKTLSLLKTKDPRIYNPEYQFFDKEKKEEEKKPKAKELSFADSDDDDDDDGDIFKVEKVGPEPEVKNKETDKPVPSTNVDKKSATAGIKEYLTGKKEHIDVEVDKDLAPLKALWSDPKLNEGEAFLRDYILNKRYLEEGDSTALEKVRDDEDLEEDEKRVEEQGQFERAYNFRFEEPDTEFLKRFPRTMNFIRPKDDRRSRKRAEIRDRKEEEKKRKMEEISRMKALKLKEIQEKIAKIKEVTGNDQLGFEEEDIEGDFDPEEHDRRMRKIFDEQYYGDADDKKPEFPDLDEELEIENWDNYEPDAEREEPQDGEDMHCEDEEFNMDADYDPKKAKADLIEELVKSQGKKRRNRKKKSVLAALLAIEKPKYVPTVADKTYEQHLEEYYKMDCEDIIGGDLPTRFKYREVVPNDFGLTVEEILLADDKELTQWVPLKKIVKHRPQNVEQSEINTYRQKAADVNLKKKMLPSLFKDLPEEPEIVVPVVTKKKKKKKKKNKKDKETTDETVDKQETIDDGENITENVDNNVENNDENNKVEEEETTPSKEETKRKKKKKKLSIKQAETEIDTSMEVDNSSQNEKKDQEESPVVNGSMNESKKEGKRKKINKANGFIVEDISEGNTPSTSKPVNGQAGQKNKEAKNESQKKGNLKRKLDSKQENVASKKKKSNQDGGKNKKDFKNKNKKDFKKQNDKSDNPLSNISDERLKAYGLNPKKYRGFLKYKKY